VEFRQKVVTAAVKELRNQLGKDAVDQNGTFVQIEGDSVLPVWWKLLFGPRLSPIQRSSRRSPSPSHLVLRTGKALPIQRLMR
jgi:hypothetical protein